MEQSSRYSQAGVDIHAADQVKTRIGELVKQTRNDHVLHKPGAFGGLFSLFQLPELKPVLVSSVDGVGTKVKIARELGQHVGIGTDLVNHCINDILTCGARPLFFLDYYACEKLDASILLQVVQGMSEACQAAHMALIGGETAQMSDVYSPGEYDLAGTIVGIVGEEEIIDGQSIEPGDKMVGLPSSGLHTNGYTLARKIFFAENHFSPNAPLEGLDRPLGETLLVPHRSYLTDYQRIQKQVSIKGMAHITGGGFEGNIPRILPEGCQAVVDIQRWEPPAIFQAIQKYGNVSKAEMYQVFNMGIGMVLIVDQEDAETLCHSEPEAIPIGEIQPGHGVQFIG